MTARYLTPEERIECEALTRQLDAEVAEVLKDRKPRFGFRPGVYKKVFEKISHWHEHEIHDRISAILGIDTWKIAIPYYNANCKENEEIDLLINFPSREDYEKCVATIVEALSLKPE